MPQQYAPERGQLGETISSSITDATQISNTVTETIMVPDTTFPANYFAQGTTLRGRVVGVCSNVVTTPGTLTYRIRMGTTTLSATAVVASRALGLDTTAQTNAPFRLDFEIVCRTVGASGTVLLAGAVQQFNVLASTAANLLPNPLPVGTNAAQTLNTTVANILSLSAQFSVATSPTNLTAQIFLLESVAV
jgi:hypothetical protein